MEPISHVWGSDLGRIKEMLSYPVCPKGRTASQDSKCKMKKVLFTTKFQVSISIQMTTD